MEARMIGEQGLLQRERERELEGGGRGVCVSCSRPCLALSLAVGRHCSHCRSQHLSHDMIWTPRQVQIYLTCDVSATHRRASRSRRERLTRSSLTLQYTSDYNIPQTWGFCLQLENRAKSV